VTPTAGSPVVTYRHGFIRSWVTTQLRILKDLRCHLGSRWWERFTLSSKTDSRRLSSRDDTRRSYETSYPYGHRALLHAITRISH